MSVITNIHVCQLCRVETKNIEIGNIEARKLFNSYSFPSKCCCLCLLKRNLKSYALININVLYFCQIETQVLK